MTKIKASRAASPYTGDLKKPIEIWHYDRDVSWHDDIGERAVALENDAHVLAERGRKLKLLIKHFQLDHLKPHAAIAALAHRLAFEHVPGFRAETSKKKGSEQQLFELALSVELTKEKSGLAKMYDIDACIELAKIQHKEDEEKAGNKNPRQLTEREAFERGRTLSTRLSRAHTLKKKYAASRKNTQEKT